MSSRAREGGERGTHARLWGRENVRRGGRRYKRVRESERQTNTESKRETKRESAW